MDRGFTTKAPGGLLNSLKSTCRISKAFDPANGVPEFELFECDAMWDTGSTKTIITQRVVDACGLKPVNTALIHSVNGTEKSECYLVNVYLPDKVTFFQLKVIRGNPSKGWFDLLIGMDIISAGNFSVMNVNSNTEFSFSIPSGKSA